MLFANPGAKGGQTFVLVFDNLLLLIYFIITSSAHACWATGDTSENLISEKLIDSKMVFVVSTSKLV